MKSLRGLSVWSRSLRVFMLASELVGSRVASPPRLMSKVSLSCAQANPQGVTWILFARLFQVIMHLPGPGMNTRTHMHAVIHMHSCTLMPAHTHTHTLDMGCISQVTSKKKAKIHENRCKHSSPMISTAIIVLNIPRQQQKVAYLSLARPIEQCVQSYHVG